MTCIFFKRWYRGDGYEITDHFDYCEVKGDEKENCPCNGDVNDCEKGEKEDE
jgi:hypothetical protein